MRVQNVLGCRLGIPDEGELQPKLGVRPASKPSVDVILPTVAAEASMSPMDNSVHAIASACSIGSSAPAESLAVAAANTGENPVPSSPESAAVQTTATKSVANHSQNEADRPSLAPDEADRQKAKALRAVVQDDWQTLADVLEYVPMDVWQKWENKAGKDLLTLSQERGSAMAYSTLAKALGLLSEMKREAFEERETVWVFLLGEVQPVRATVLEDTPEEADEILVEFWEGENTEPVHVERCMVRRIGS